MTGVDIVISDCTDATEALAEAEADYIAKKSALEQAFFEMERCREVRTRTTNALIVALEKQLADYRKRNGRDLSVL